MLYSDVKSISAATTLTTDDFNIQRVQSVMVLVGIVCSVTLYTSSYFIKENKYVQREEPLGFKEGIVETFKNKPFLILEIAIFTSLMGQTILMGSGILFLIEYILVFDNIFEYLYLSPAAFTMVFLNCQILTCAP